MKSRKKATCFTIFRNHNCLSNEVFHHKQTYVKRKKQKQKLSGRTPQCLLFEFALDKHSDSLLKGSLGNKGVLGERAVIFICSLLELIKHLVIWS